MMLRHCLAFVAAVHSAGHLGSSAELRILRAQAVDDEGASTANTADIPILNLIPRPDWINVKSLGAKGDGATDDSAPIQKALDLISGCKAPTMLNTTAYFPPGRYRISESLILCGVQKFFNIGFNVVGHGASSVLVWSGAANGTMLHDEGVTYGTISGLAFDGAAQAGVGIWHNSHTHYGSFMLHEHLSFTNLTWAGMMTAEGGGTVSATAEVRINNCRFTNCHFAIYLKAFNDYDYAVSGCHFADNQVGIMAPHGNFDVRDSRFERSNVTDLYFGPIPSGAHRVVSINSTTFAIAGGCHCYWKHSTFQMNDCHVLGWKGSAMGGWWDRFAPLPAIGLAFRGPVSVFDSTFVSLQDPALPRAPIVASWTPQHSVEICPAGWWDSSGGIFQDFNKTHYWGRSIIVGNNIYNGPLVHAFPEDDVLIMNKSRTNRVPRANISESTQFLRTWWEKPTRVFNVMQFGTNKTGNGQTNDTESVQACVSAAAAAGNGAVCYLPPGTYNVYSTIKLEGGNFSVEGSGMRTMISKRAANSTAWPAAANGSLFEVSSRTATHVAVRQMQPISTEPGSPVFYMGPAQIAPRLLHLEYILLRESPMSVPCPDPSKSHNAGCGAFGDRCSGPSGCIDTPQDRSLRTAMVFEELSATDTVLIDFVEGGQYWKDSSSATYLRSCGSGWTVIEAPKATLLATARDIACNEQFQSSNLSASVPEECASATAAANAYSKSTGFFGELMVFNSGNTFGLTVRDGQSYVSDYFYTESTERIVHLGPGTGLASGGLVTMTGTKSSTDSDTDMLHVDGFVGNFTLLKTGVDIQTSSVDGAFVMTLAATLPKGSNLLFVGNHFDGNPPQLSVSGGGQLFTLGNIVEPAYFALPPQPPPKFVAWCNSLAGRRYSEAVEPWNQANTCGTADSSGPDRALAEEQVRLAFDHKLLLGQHNLRLNFPHL